MDTLRRIAWEYRSLGLALALVAALGVAVTSCGGGGDDADGRLCSQCGNDPDGPCLPAIEVEREPDAPFPCNEPSTDTSPCIVRLGCFRMLGSAQRRCYPLVPLGDEPQPQFECNGERANASTPVPTTTPTVTESSTPRPTNTNLPTVTPFGL
jgi:hypothetical protein